MTFVAFRPVAPHPRAYYVVLLNLTKISMCVTQQITLTYHPPINARFMWSSNGHSIDEIKCSGHGDINNIILILNVCTPKTHLLVEVNARFFCGKENNKADTY